MTAIAAFIKSFDTAGYILGPPPATAKHAWTYAHAYAGALDSSRADWNSIALSAVKAANNCIELLKQAPNAKYVAFEDRIEDHAMNVITTRVTFVIN